MMKTPALIILIIAAWCSSASAQNNELIINDTEISWTDSGWYQVLALPDYVTVCEGGTRCEVLPGHYLVINHTSGMRWESVTVGSLPSGFPIEFDTGVTVNGSLLSWPDDGWYQVQSLDDFSVYCEGTLFCNVPSGNYVVINHTTGERTEPVNVTAETTAEINPGPIVTNGVISWSEDGWYQVQDADSYANVCEGGSSCSVQAGRYIVINLTTGMRWEDVQVDSVVTTQGDPVQAFMYELVQTAALPLYELNLNWISGTTTEQELLDCAQPTDVRNPPWTAYYNSLNCVDVPLLLRRQSIDTFIRLDQAIFDGFGNAVEVGTQSDGSLNCTSAGISTTESCQLNALSMTIPLIWVQSPSTGAISCIACGIRPIVGNHIEFDAEQSNILVFTPDPGSAALSVNYRCELNISNGSLRNSSTVFSGTNCLTEMNNLTERLQEFRLANRLADSLL